MTTETPETSTKSGAKMMGEAFAVGFFSTLGMLTAFEMIRNRHLLAREFKSVCAAIANS